MTEIPPRVRKALEGILDYLTDEYSHFETHCSDVLEKPFDLDQYNGDPDSIPDGVRDHVFFHALVLEYWFKRPQNAIPDDIF